MAIDDGCNISAIDLSGHCGMIRLRLNNSHGFITIPTAFNLQSMCIESPASVALAVLIRVVVLKSFLIHSVLPMKKFKVPIVCYLEFVICIFRFIRVRGFPSVVET